MNYCNRNDRNKLVTMKLNFKHILYGSLLMILINSCGFLVGSGATLGTAALEERGLGGAIDDKLIQGRINVRWLAAGSTLFTRLSCEVHDGKVLVTGAVTNPGDRIEAVRIAWQVDGVRKVINHIEIRNHSSLTDYTRDTWISAQLKLKLTIDSAIKAINYSIDTVNGHIFIMGIAQNQVELERVQAHAYNIQSVRRVTNYAVLKTDPASRLQINVPPSFIKK